MQVDLNTLIVLVGLLLHGAAVAGTMIKFALSNERRMTRLETLFEHQTLRQPHRVTDEPCQDLSR